MAKKSRSNSLRILGLIVVLALVGIVIYNGILFLRSDRQSTSNLNGGHSFEVSLTTLSCWTGLIGGVSSGDISVQGCGSHSWNVTDIAVNVSLQAKDGQGQFSLSITKDGQLCFQKNDIGSIAGAC